MVLTRPVAVDLFVNQAGWPQGLGMMEAVHQSLMVKRWKKIGMRIDDSGYIGNIFLRVMQITEVRQFANHGNCRNERVLSLSLMFEGGRGAKCTGRRRTLTSPLASALMVSEMRPCKQRPIGRGTAWDGWATGTPRLESSRSCQSTPHISPSSMCTFSVVSSGRGIGACRSFPQAIDSSKVRRSDRLP